MPFSRALTARRNATWSPYRITENFTQRRRPGEGEQVACQNRYSAPLVNTVTCETPTTPERFLEERVQILAFSPSLIFFKSRFRHSLATRKAF